MSSAGTAPPPPSPLPLPKAGTSITMSGVRPGSSETSTVMPAMTRLLHQVATRSTARAMCPLAAQSASKAADTLGMAM